MEEKRIAYLDTLRVVAAFAVVTLHVAASQWRHVDVYSTQWMAYNVWDSCSRFGVPVFVMITGVLFGGRDVAIKRLYTHNIKRIVLALVFLVVPLCGSDYSD